MAESPGANCKAQFFRITYDILSGPIDFDTFIFFNSFSIPGAVMTNEGMSNLKHFGNLAKVLVPSFVETEIH